jgi:hypothetical protein
VKPEQVSRIVRLMVNNMMLFECTLNTMGIKKYHKVTKILSNPFSDFKLTDFKRGTMPMNNRLSEGHDKWLSNGNESSLGISLND